MDAFTSQIIQWLNIAEASYIATPILLFLILIAVLVLIKRVGRAIVLLEALLHKPQRKAQEPANV